VRTYLRALGLAVDVVRRLTVQILARFSRATAAGIPAFAAGLTSAQIYALAESLAQRESEDCFPPSRVAAARERAELVRALVVARQRMGAEQWECVRAAEVGRLSTMEIAARMHLSEPEVRRRIREGRRQVKKEIDVHLLAAG
jgi:DNA-directed RNA polymerase specialized sigma24 family protein